MKAIQCKISALLFWSFVLTGCVGCEGYRCANGLIKDAMTNIPIDSVKIFVFDVNETKYTNSSGFFSACGEFGSCMSGCKDIILQFSKNGYKTKKVKNPDPDVIILMEPE